MKVLTIIATLLLILVLYTILSACSQTIVNVQTTKTGINGGVEEKVSHFGTTSLCGDREFKNLFIDVKNKIVILGNFKEQLDSLGLEYNPYLNTFKLKTEGK